jgi:rhamnosyltransferase
MVENSVCGVIITFHPQQDVLVNLMQLRPQIQHLVVVDNGSSKEELTPFHEKIDELQFFLIENGENLGIAAALNIGVRWAKSQNCEWVILLDQDSTVAEGFIAAMLSEFATRPTAQNVAIVVPSYVDKYSGYPMPLYRDGKGQILLACTSGSLIPLGIFDRCGWFREEFVIDYVDYEYCLRVRELGYSIIQCSNTILIHPLGERRRHGLGNLYLFTSTHHNAKRRYYITRNRLAMIRMYWKKDPNYCMKLILVTLKDLIKIILVEKMKFQKIKNTARGILDGIRGRMGMTVEL